MSLIITLTGMSTCGKSTLAKALSQSANFQEAVSVTTRQMRPGEVNGVDYHFISNEQFDQYVEQGVLLEHVRSHHAAYGVPAFEVENILSQGKSPVLVLEPMGVRAIHQVAQQRDYNFLSVYVHTDMLTIMDRFLKRIHGQLELGKDVNYSQEAKRLQTMLNVEKQWAHAWPWDMTLINLHQENSLETALQDFEGYHQKASHFLALPGATLESSTRRPGKSLDELEKTIRLVIGSGYDAAFFHSQLIDSGNNISARNKMVDIEPSL